MKYDVIALACEQLDYRDKLRLAQLLIQLARKEEEVENPKKRTQDSNPQNKQVKPKQTDIVFAIDKETITYVKERIIKLKPTKMKSLSNSISAMFQFQGGISEQDQQKIIKELQKQKFIKVNNNKVSYV